MRRRTSNPANFRVDPRVNARTSRPGSASKSPHACMRSMQPDISAKKITLDRSRGNVSQAAQPATAHSFHPRVYQSPANLALAAQSLVGIMGVPASTSRTHNGTDLPMSLQSSRINICRGDSVNAKKQKLQEMQRWGYLRDHFLAQDQSARNTFIQQLCGVSALPADLSAELASVLNKVLARGLPTNPTVPLLKTCRHCKKTFRTTKRRLAPSSKTKYAINFFVCKDCRIGHAEYADFAQLPSHMSTRRWLQPPGDISSVWNSSDGHIVKCAKIKSEPRHFEARGRAWTHLSNNRRDKVRALIKHRQTIGKLISIK